MYNAELVIAFVFGLIYGSFLNVVILRFNEWRSILTGRSHCPKCKTDLRWYDLVPVVSYATLRGRCRYCGKPISWQYPVVELLMGGLVAGSYGLLFTGTLSLLAAVFAFVFLLIALGSVAVIVFQDLDEMKISDYLSYVLIISAILFTALLKGWNLGIIYAAAIGFLPIALLVYPSRGKWMGEGDVKLSLGLGVLVGYPNALVFIVSAFLVGGVYGVAALLAKKAKLKTAVPFAPFLAVGAVIALFWGSAIVAWYLKFITGGI